MTIATFKCQVCKIERRLTYSDKIVLSRSTRIWRSQGLRRPVGRTLRPSGKLDPDD